MVEARTEVIEVEPPTDLVERLSSEGHAELREWWGSLANHERASVAALWRDDTVLAVVDHGELEVLLEARFVTPDDRHDGITLELEEEWLTRTAFLEWLYAHQEYLPAPQVFHICRAHPRARTVVHAGRIPAGFACPLAHAGCPLRRLLAHRPGCDVVLTAVRRAVAG